MWKTVTEIVTKASTELRKHCCGPSEEGGRGQCTWTQAWFWFELWPAQPAGLSWCETASRWPSWQSGHFCKRHLTKFHDCHFSHPPDAPTPQSNRKPGSRTGNSSP